MKRESVRFGGDRSDASAIDSQTDLTATLGSQAVSVAYGEESRWRGIDDAYLRFVGNAEVDQALEPYLVCDSDLLATKTYSVPFIAADDRGRARAKAQDVDPKGGSACCLVAVFVARAADTNVLRDRFKAEADAVSERDSQNRTVFLQAELVCRVAHESHPRRAIVSRGAGLLGEMNRARATDGSVAASDGLQVDGDRGLLERGVDEFDPERALIGRWLWNAGLLWGSDVAFHSAGWVHRVFCWGKPDVRGGEERKGDRRHRERFASSPVGENELGVASTLRGVEALDVDAALAS